MTDDGPLTKEAILLATEDVLRKYGPSKATVVDVARVLGVSHGSVYRHFPSKLALREAVTERWLERAHAGLAELIDADGPAADRLAQWIRTLAAAKKRKALDDPELFHTYSALVQEQNAAVVEEHLANLIAQLEALVLAGIRDGGFVELDTKSAAQAIFYATIAFHSPTFADRWSRPEISDELEAVISLILQGLKAR